MNFDSNKSSHLFGELIYQLNVPPVLENISAVQSLSLIAQVEAIRLADFLQSMQIKQKITVDLESAICDRIANLLEKAASYLREESRYFFDALVSQENARAIRSNKWDGLTQVFLENFEKIGQPVVIAPVPAMHNHPYIWTGFVAIVSESAMKTGIAINHPRQFIRLNNLLYPNCPVRLLNTRFVGANLVKATKIHHPPYFIPEYLPNCTISSNASVGYLLNTYITQSVEHTLYALEPFWESEQWSFICSYLKQSDANEVQAALVSLHNMTHFLGSQPMNCPNKQSKSFLQGADEELRADSGSNRGLAFLGEEFFDPKLIEAVILMDILDRVFKYTLTVPVEGWQSLLTSHHDAAAGQMRLNALRQHGAIEYVSTSTGVKYYLDYKACLESDRIIIQELEKLDIRGIEKPDSYWKERLKFLENYLDTNEDNGWQVDSFYYEVINRHPWLSARLEFKYPFESGDLFGFSEVA